MASARNYQSKNANVSSRNQTANDADFTPQVVAMGESQGSFVDRNIDYLCEMISYWRWFPDLFLDLITPETGGIKLHTDQRIYLRTILRFYSTYGVFPRGWGKTWGEVLGAFLVCLFYPSSHLAMTAQTKQASADILGTKLRTEIFKQYPLLENEVVSKKFSQDSGEVILSNGSILDILANAQTSKGQRRTRINIEEAALLNNELYLDVLEPIPALPRYTAGKLSVFDPEEMNFQINFFTTSGWRGSDEFERSIQMVDDMANLTGKMVLGADWHLACWYGRGNTKSQILQKKRTSSQVSFDQNYGSKWTGTTDGALVDIKKLLALRTLEKSEKESENGFDYVISVDVARSENTSNNKSSISVLKLVRTNGRLVSVENVNLQNISNSMNFTGQALEVKRTWRSFNKHGRVIAVIVDENGLGKGLKDELMKEHIDPSNNMIYPCFDTINTNDVAETEMTMKILYALNATGIQTEIITSFIDYVDSGKLKLLVKKTNSDLSMFDLTDLKNEMVPYIHTDSLIEEVSNLKLKTMPSGKLQIERVVKRVDKDRFSALVYGCWYIKTFEEYVINQDTSDGLDAWENVFGF